MDFLRRTWAEINIDALIHNFNTIKELSGGNGVMPVIKANAYGHSAVDLAPLLEILGANSFAVSNLEEAVALREAGIKVPILILGYTPPTAAEEINRYDITQCVYSLEYAHALSDNCKNFNIDIHIKLDTGMGRIGFDCRSDKLCEIEDAITAAQLPHLNFKGIFTHFAVSDRTPNTEDGFTDAQYARFTAAIEKFSAAGLKPSICHCCNSAAVYQDIPKHLDTVRAGIILYGLTPSTELPLPQGFKSVMSFKSIVSMVKDIEQGDTVSYGRTFTAQKRMRVATVSAGYADGYPRLLSNKGEVLIKGKRAPVIGRICMDQFIVDVSHIEDVKMGEEVVLFGNGLPVEELAALCGTINYEIVCGISSRVPRIIK